MQWTVLIPAKSLPEAKSRLLDASTDTAGHARLVRAIREDTVAAARGAANVARVVIVADRPGAQGEHVLVQTEPGLNPALREGAAYAAARWPEHGIAALVGDLPALQPEELAAALAAAAAHPRAFVPDAHGTGTTLLTARPATELAPAFGLGSAQRHGTSAVALAAGAGLRHDVDTEGDLRAASRHGLGPHTRAALPSESGGAAAAATRHD